MKGREEMKKGVGEEKGEKRTKETFSYLLSVY